MIIESTESSVLGPRWTFVYKYLVPEGSIYWRTFKTQHFDSSFKSCLKRESKTIIFGCILKSVHLQVTHEKWV